MPRALAAAAFLVLAAPAFLSAETCPQILRTLQLDDRGSDVAALQTFLSDHGFLPAIAESGYFDADTQTAVQKYQASLGIVSVGSPATTKWGVVGPVTISALSTCKLPAVKAVIPVPVYRTSTPISSNSVSSGSVSLSLGSKGVPVTALQQQLVSLGLLAPENATGYFGNLTRAAVLQFQTQHGIAQVGSVGPVTRAALASAQGSGGSLSYTASLTPNSSPSPSPTPSPATSQSSLAALLQQINDLQARIATLRGGGGSFTAPTTISSVNPSSATPSPSPTPTSSPTPRPTIFFPPNNASIPASSLTTVDWTDFTSYAGGVTYEYESSNAPTANANGSFTNYIDKKVGLIASEVPAVGMAPFTYYLHVRAHDASGFVSPWSDTVKVTITASINVSPPPTPPPPPYQPPPPPTPPPPAYSSCTFNGQTVGHGASVTAYQSSSVSFGGVCISQIRTCSNGTLSGTYQYSGCSIGGAASCSLDSTTVAHNAAQTFYGARTVPFGSLCSAVSQSRTCSNGTLSGESTYQYASCSVGVASSCSFNNQSIANGATVTAYQSASVAYGQQCTSQTRTCSNGTLSGTYTNAACIVGAAQSCTFNNQAVSNGTSVTAYQASTVPFGASCLSETRTCTNGTLSGSYVYNTCSANAPTSCTFNGQSVAHNASVTAYQAATVPFGQQCVSQTRSCSNGTLSGTYTNAACTVGTPASCTFNGQTVANGQSVTAYSQSTVSYGNSCSSVSQTRTCSNGTLSGTYTNAGCSVDAAASCTFNGSTIAHGASATAYQSSSVQAGQQCISESRACSNGTLSGSYTNGSCTVASGPVTAITVTQSSGGNFVATADGQQSALYSGTHFINDVLQPSITLLSANGGGTITIRSSSTPYPIGGSGDTTQIILKSKVNIQGEVDGSGLPATKMTVMQSAGNIFFHGVSEHDYTLSNLTIDAADIGTYVVSLYKPVNVTVKNIRIPNTAATGFGHFQGTNTRYIDCYTDTHALQPGGHGFAVGGNDGTGQDTGTQIINSEAHGFHHSTGGQGIQLRPPLPSYGADPTKLNTSIQIIGGKYTDNLIGIWLQGSDNVLIRGTEVSNNSQIGVFIYAPLENAPVVPNTVQIENSTISRNGSNTRRGYGDAGISYTRSNVTVLNSTLDGNLPFQFWSNGSNLSLQQSTLTNSYTVQPYNFHFEGDPIGSLRSVGNSIGSSNWPDEGSPQILTNTLSPNANLASVLVALQAILNSLKATFGQ